MNERVWNERKRRWERADNIGFTGGKKVSAVIEDYGDRSRAIRDGIRYSLELIDKNENTVDIPMEIEGTTNSFKTLKDARMFANMLFARTKYSIRIIKITNGRKSVQGIMWHPKERAKKVKKKPIANATDSAEVLGGKTKPTSTPKSSEIDIIIRDIVNDGGRLTGKEPKPRLPKGSENKKGVTYEGKGVKKPIVKTPKNANFEDDDNLILIK